MIIVRITGGLGNQMFQYAAGWSLSRRLGVSLKLDLSAYGQAGSRPFELDRLHTVIDTAKPSELESYGKLSPWQRALERLKPAYQRHIYKQPGFAYDPNFPRAGDGAYLKGYWQSWKFFEGYEAEIRAAFQVREEYTREVQALSDSLCDGNTVSVHIRRGDYKTPEALAYHGLLPASYYLAAIQRMRTLHPDARFLLFSDDINWVRVHIDPKQEMIPVTGTLTNTALEDFYLMQRCRHHIIANSSYSWWAAWLNAVTGKTVIAPNQWFATRANETRDMCPPSWIRL